MDPGLDRRDQAIDLVRGAALVTIFVNHVPGTVFERLTHRNFGLSDATEVFVLLAGYAAALAYGRDFEGDRGLALSLKSWSRAAQIYVAHLVCLLVAFAIVGWISLRTGDPRFLSWVDLAPIFDDPTVALIGIMTLGHQPGYFNILPMYVLFLLALPGLLALGRRRPRTLLAASAALWLAANLRALNLPNYPNDTDWYFNPLTWQMLFVTGLILRLERRRLGQWARRQEGWATPLAVAYLAVCLVMKLADVAVEPDMLPLPFFVVGDDKTYLSLPRLLHVLALAYLVTRGQFWQRIGDGAATLAAGRALALLGRHGLAVFCLGSVLSIIGQVAHFFAAGRGLADAVILGIGIATMLAVSAVMEWQKRTLRRAAPVSPG